MLTLIAFDLACLSISPYVPNFFAGMSVTIELNRSSIESISTCEKLHAMNLAPTVYQLSVHVYIFGLPLSLLLFALCYAYCYTCTAREVDSCRGRE